MNLYIDLDRTILDSDSLYNYLDRLIKEVGVDLPELDDFRISWKKENPLFNYFKLVEDFKHEFKIDLDIDSITKASREYLPGLVYKDVLPFFDKARESKAYVSILTYGDIEFQNHKITAIENILDFDETKIMEIHKWHLGDISKNSVFIDDNPRDVAGLKEKYPFAKVIEIKRLNTKYVNSISSKGDYLVTGLNEAQAILFS